MRISNRVKRNISLILAILGCFIILARAWNLAMGDGTWWEVVSAGVITFCAFIGYIDYRKKVVEGKLFG